MPEDTPTIIPVGVIVAIAGLETDHMTPPIEVKVAVPPMHIDVGLEINGDGWTVTFVVLKQPVPAVYVTVAVPALNPVTIPEPDPTATMTELLFQMPPAVAQDKVIELPTQTLVPPVIAAGNGLAVITFVTVQPVPKE